MTLSYVLAGLVLLSWVGSALYCSRVVRRAWELPVADEETIVARYSRQGRGKMDMAKLKGQIPQLETMVPGLRYTAFVPASLAGMFALNAVTRIVWLKDDTAGVWFAVALIFVPVALTVYVLAWEQGLLLARLKEVAGGPSGMRVADLRARLAEEKAAQTAEAQEGE